MICSHDDFILTSLLFLSFLINNSQQNYYVLLLGSNKILEHLKKTFKTINILYHIEPGGTIYVMNGLYRNEGYGTANPHISDGSLSQNMNNPPAVIISKSGQEGKYITIRNLPGHKPRKFSLMEGVVF